MSSLSGSLFIHDFFKFGPSAKFSYLFEHPAIRRLPPKEGERFRRVLSVYKKISGKVVKQR